MGIDIKVKKSQIAGNGVFANRKIKKGEAIFTLAGELCSLEEIIERVKKGLEEPSDPLGIGNEMYLDLDEIPRAFNHSCEPNAFIKGKSELVALRDITKGEEITYDYSTTMDDNLEKITSSGLPVWTCKCNCGSPNCRGIINQFNTLPEKVQNFYLSNKFLPDRMLEKFGVR